MSDAPEPAETSGYASSTVERYRASLGGTRADHRHGAMGSFRLRLLLTDISLVAGALLLGLLASSRQSAWQIDPTLAIYGTPVVIGVLWLVLLVSTGTYDDRRIGDPVEELRRIALSSVFTFAVVAGVSYLARADVSRAYAFVSLPVGLAAVSLAHILWSRWLRSQRRSGALLEPVVVVGDGHSGSELATRLSSRASAGFQVAGRVSGAPSSASEIPSWLAEISRAVDETGASAVAYAPGGGTSSESVRQLAWLLEGRSIDLYLSPGIMDLSGPRLSVRSAGGLRLLHVDEATLTSRQRTLKRTLDVVGSVFAIVLLSPVFVVVSVAVAATSAGPVIFRQKRVGRAGHTFTMLKFRSMRVNAEHEVPALRESSRQHGPMFKLATDPRVTPVGRFIRRWSLDELPQFFNVLGGSMSLVGPRPHPSDDVERYPDEAFRRLALKPGMTGLWQVEGRSDTTWQDALALDLQYVERWSVALDIVILMRTVGVVARGVGAR